MRGAQTTQQWPSYSACKAMPQSLFAPLATAWVPNQHVYTWRDNRSSSTTLLRGRRVTDYGSSTTTTAHQAAPIVTARIDLQMRLRQVAVIVVQNQLLGLRPCYHETRSKVGDSEANVTNQPERVRRPVSSPLSLSYPQNGQSSGFS